MMTFIVVLLTIVAATSMVFLLEKSWNAFKRHEEYSKMKYLPNIQIYVLSNTNMSVFIPFVIPMKTIER